MIARIPFASLSRWGQTSLVLALTGLPLLPSCTTSEDTEPFVPAAEGATQPSGDGTLLSEADACSELLKAAQAAYERLGCDAPQFPDCPGFLRPGGGSGCYEYYEDSVTTCVAAYADAGTCRDLSPCLATAELNDRLPTCTLEGGQGGSGGGGGASDAAGGASGGAAEGGATSPPEGGSPGASGAPAASAGQPAGGAGP
jgi:hypothetical protein